MHSCLNVLLAIVGVANVPIIGALSLVVGLIPCFGLVVIEVWFSLTCTLILLNATRYIYRTSSVGKVIHQYHKISNIIIGVGSCMKYAYK